MIGLLSVRPIWQHGQPGTTGQDVVDNCGLSANFSRFHRDESVGTARGGPAGGQRGLPSVVARQAAGSVGYLVTQDVFLSTCSSALAG